MSSDEQDAWDELEEAGVRDHGAAAHRQHLRRHLTNLQGLNFPEETIQEIRKEIDKP